jgi:hypothetical protein
MSRRPHCSRRQLAPQLEEAICACPDGHVQRGGAAAAVVAEQLSERSQRLREEFLGARRIEVHLEFAPCGRPNGMWFSCFRFRTRENDVAQSL